MLCDYSKMPSVRDLRITQTLSRVALLSSLRRVRAGTGKTTPLSSRRPALPKPQNVGGVQTLTTTAGVAVVLRKRWGSVLLK